MLKFEFYFLNKGWFIIIIIIIIIIISASWNSQFYRILNFYYQLYLFLFLLSKVSYFYF